VGLFGGKNDDANKSTAPTKPGANDAPPRSIEKATRFYDHARTVHEATNYEYAVQSWLSGMRFDPDSITALEGFCNSMAAFLGESGGKRGVSKDVARSISGKNDVDRYLTALLEWAQRPDDPVLATRAVEAAGQAGLPESCVWLAQRALPRVVKDKKPRKDLALKISEAAQKVGAFDMGVSAAEAALRVDPSDGEISAMIRTLAAQATMARGGYEKTGDAGGFRQNVRDIDRQRQLEEAERVVKTDEAVERLIAAAEVDLKARPDDLPTLDRLAKLLMERGRPADEERAHQIYTHAFKQGKQFRFRELAGDIRIRQQRRTVAELKRMLEQAPGDEDVTRMHADAESQLNALEVAEWKLRVEAYPTDMARRFELGKRYFRSGMFNEAIEALQEAQADPKNRVHALNLLAQSFLKIDWVDEAVEAFRRALEGKEITPETQMELRYGLMAALESRARNNSDLAAAEEAERIASSIAVQQITYRDIRQRRESAKRLAADLRAGRTPT
jgi:tetratricopeptide (TPR) repeat protein